MEYVKTVKRVYSEMLEHNVSILKYKSNDNFPYCNCDRCGLPIKKVMYVVQNDETDIEEMYLGSECIKHFW